MTSVRSRQIRGGSKDYARYFLEREEEPVLQWLVAARFHSRGSTGAVRTVTGQGAGVGKHRAVTHQECTREIRDSGLSRRRHLASRYFRFETGCRRGSSRQIQRRPQQDSRPSCWRTVAKTGGHHEQAGARPFAATRERPSRNGNELGGGRK